MSMCEEMTQYLQNIILRKCNLTRQCNTVISVRAMATGWAAVVLTCQDKNSAQVYQRGEQMSYCIIQILFFVKILD